MAKQTGPHLPILSIAPRIVQEKPPMHPTGDKYLSSNTLQSLSSGGIGLRRLRSGGTRVRLAPLQFSEYNPATSTTAADYVRRPVNSRIITGPSRRSCRDSAQRQPMSPEKAAGPSKWRFKCRTSLYIYWWKTPPPPVPICRGLGTPMAPAVLFGR